jgi:hypothetical protein
MSASEEWESLKKELRQDADRAIASAVDQKRKDSIRGQLTSFARLPIPASDYELNQRRTLANEYRTAWEKAAKDGRVQEALFGWNNKKTASDGG